MALGQPQCRVGGPLPSAACAKSVQPCCPVLIHLNPLHVEAENAGVVLGADGGARRDNDAKVGQENVARATAEVLKTIGQGWPDGIVAVRLRQLCSCK